MSKRCHFFNSVDFIELLLLLIFISISNFCFDCINQTFWVWAIPILNCFGLWMMVLVSWFSALKCRRTLWIRTSKLSNVPPNDSAAVTLRRRTLFHTLTIIYTRKTIFHFQLIINLNYPRIGHLCFYILQYRSNN